MIDTTFKLNLTFTPRDIDQAEYDRGSDLFAAVTSGKSADEAYKAAFEACDLLNAPGVTADFIDGYGDRFNEFRDSNGIWYEKPLPIAM